MITLQPIGFVRNSRKEIEDDNWGGIISEIALADSLSEESLWGLEEFSHAEIVFYFDKVDEGKIITGARHPRNNPAWPRVGIFAQRGKNRPNRIGLAVVRVIGRAGKVLRVEGLDAIDGTPVLDIKPVMAEFLPQSNVRQPDWSKELMRDYWNAGNQNNGSP
ncbi:MAG: SAM-dependent methyltransferase [Chloroflexi bacterium]|nr:SAM-dependent methyltransferase [Chloroflexota bacterium]